MTPMSVLFFLLFSGTADAAVAETKPEPESDAKTKPAVNEVTAAELERIGGLPVEIVVDTSHEALDSPEFEAHCRKLVIEALAKRGVKAREAKVKAKPSKKRPLLLRVEVSGGVTDKSFVAAGARFAVTLSARATLAHETLDLRRFTVKSQYTRESVAKAGAFAMKHAADEIGPKLVTALDAWAKN